jgi:hypothetical protein
MRRTLGGLALGLEGSEDSSGSRTFTSPPRSSPLKSESASSEAIVRPAKKKSNTYLPSHNISDVAQPSLQDAAVTDTATSAPPLPPGQTVPLDPALAVDLASPPGSPSQPSYTKYLHTVGGPAVSSDGNMLQYDGTLGILDHRQDTYSDDLDSGSGSKGGSTLEDAFNKNNIAYTTCICGVLSALVEFCIRQKRDPARRILELHPELMRSLEHLIPNAGVTLTGSKRVMTAQDYDLACKTLYCAKRDIQIADAFELRDAAKLEMLYSGGLKTGIIEACRRNEYTIAKRLCHNLYRKTPSYRVTRIGSFSGETLGVQRMLDQLHNDVCQLCDIEDSQARGRSRTCCIL